jgi:hypothetical protein
MDLSVPVVSLILPPLLAVCLDFGDSPPVLTGTISSPFSPPACALQSTAVDCCSFDGAVRDALTVDINNHVEREFWGLRFIGSILAPEATIANKSIPLPNGSVCVPHGPCVWMRCGSLICPSFVFFVFLCFFFSMFRAELYVTLMQL